MSAQEKTQKTDFNKLVMATANQVQGLVEFLEKTSVEDYNKQPNEQASAIGPHMRHVLDFYSELLKGMESGIISYDSRTRDESIQTDPRHAANFAKTIKDGLNELTQDFNVTVSGGVPGANEPAQMPSSLSRELYSAYEHTTHHLAMIKMIGQQIGMTFDKDFGVATSTKHHLNTT